MSYEEVYDQWIDLVVQRIRSFVSSDPVWKRWRKEDSGRWFAVWKDGEIVMEDRPDFPDDWIEFSENDINAKLAPDIFLTNIADEYLIIVTDELKNNL